MDEFKLYLAACTECVASGKRGGSTCYACDGQRVSIVSEDDDHDIVVEIEMIAEDEVN